MLKNLFLTVSILVKIDIEISRVEKESRENTAKQALLVVLERYNNQQPALKGQRHTHIIFELEHQTTKKHFVALVTHGDPPGVSTLGTRLS